jgi:hypothetical protein
MAPAEPEASTRAPDVTTARAAFWSDDFDMDLLRLVPEVPELLGDTGARTLYVRGGTSHGRLNHPAAWLDNTSTNDGTDGLLVEGEAYRLAVTCVQGGINREFNLVGYVRRAGAS